MPFLGSKGAQNLACYLLGNTQLEVIFVFSFWRLIGFFAQSRFGNQRSTDGIPVIIKVLFKSILLSFNYSSSVD